MSDKKKLLVVIDPGHTGNTYNAGAVKGYYESKAVYDLSLYEKAAFEKRGIDVILTRERNQNPGLCERGRMAVKKGCGYANVVFESNHSNAFNGKAYGVNIIRSAHLPASEKLADRMIDAIVKVMKPSTGITYNRGVTTKTQSNGADWYGVIRGAVSGATTQGQAKNGPVRYDYVEKGAEFIETLPFMLRPLNIIYIYFAVEPEECKEDGSYCSVVDENTFWKKMTEWHVELEDKKPEEIPPWKERL